MKMASSQRYINRVRWEILTFSESSKYVFREQFNIFSWVSYQIYFGPIFSQIVWFLWPDLTQFLVLGFGLRELHYDCEPLMDEHLEVNRRRIPIVSGIWSGHVANELRDLMELFDGCTLSLLQLSRIAVRHADSGHHFIRRIKFFRSHLPLLLLKYVAEPSDLMHISLLPDPKIFS